MKVSNMKKMLLGSCLWAAAAGLGVAQNQWIDSILPPDHLLENLPWMGDDGKIDSKGLFDFEDIRGIGQKDLVLIYRQSVPVNEMDKPHNQTLIVCFYDPKQQKYIKSFEDEGGTIQWVNLVKDPQTKVPFLIVERDDLKGGQVLKGFSYLGGAMKPVLEAMAPQVFVKFTNGFQGPAILCSSKGVPKDTNGAEHVFAWDAAKSQFTEGKTNGTAGWTGSSITVPAVAETKASPVTQAAVVAPKGHPSKNGWWDEPIDLQTALTKLTTELAPELIKKGEIAVLGQKAKLFFAELQKKGTPAKEIAGARASYYAAVASAVLDKGDAKGAAYYLKLALQFQSDNPAALAVKEKIK